MSRKTGTTENDYGFAGEQFDSHVGQYYLRARYYDTSNGRFAGRDPFEGEMTEPLSLAKYPYVHGNPVNGVDPSGMFTIGEVAIDNTRAALQRAYEASSAIRPVGTVSKISLRLVVYATLLAATLYTLAHLIEDGDNYGLPIVVWAKDIPETTAHTSDALSGRSTGFKGGFSGFGSPVLMRINFPRTMPPNRNRRGWKRIFGDWYNQEPQCRNPVIGKSCDEYPYNTTIPGGPIAYNLNLVSLKPVSAKEQDTQGAWLSSFYRKANIEPWNPQKGWFAVATTEGDKSYWIARGETEKNYFK